ncbi:MAG: D-tyrosyl-tRNA(Tyr) deacylase [Clostridia bacterium]|nr:D-tyrosyl-tRNA(Tyr) deacylase [Clostridia bacterium]
MRAVVQRVKWSHVDVDGERVGTIEQGLMVLLGVMDGDTEADCDYIAKKVALLRIFEDSEDKMNLSVGDVGGSVLVISQFTLAGDARHGNRPSFSNAARPEIAEPLCERTMELIRAKGLKVETGRFRTHMEVSLLNDGPVTILLDSRREF